MKLISKLGKKYLKILKGLRIARNVYPQMINSSFLKGKKFCSFRNYIKIFKMFKIFFKTKLDINQFLQFFLFKLRFKYNLKLKRVGGVYYRIPIFINAKQELLLTLKKFIYYINVSNYIKTFKDKFVNELVDYAQNKSRFKRMKLTEDKVAIYNRSFTRYLKIYKTKTQLRSDIDYFYLKYLKYRPFYKTIQTMFLFQNKEYFRYWFRFSYLRGRFLLRMKKIQFYWLFYLHTTKKKINLLLSGEKPKFFTSIYCKYKYLKVCIKYNEFLKRRRSK
jgi:ribosomal protein S7